MGCSWSGFTAEMRRRRVTTVKGIFGLTNVSGQINRGSWAAVAGRAAGVEFQSGGVAGEFGDVAEAAGEALEELGVEPGAGGGEAVVAPEACLAGLDEAGAAEVGEVAGGLGLGDAEDGDDIADAELAAAAEHGGDAEAGAVGEGAEEEVDARGGGFGLRFGRHIRLGECMFGWGRCQWRGGGCGM